MRAIEINQEIDLAQASYSSVMSLRSKGMAGMFMKVETDMKTTGSIVEGVPVPTSFRIAQKDRRARVSFDHANKPEAVRDPDLKPNKAEAIDAALAEPAVDPLSAILQQGFAGEDQVCSGSERVYNGREVTEYRFERLDEGQFGKSDASVYRGPVIRCRLAYHMIAGFSDKAMAKNRAEPVIITFWVREPVETSAAGKPLMIVVAVNGKSTGGPSPAFSTLPPFPAGRSTRFARQPLKSTDRPFRHSPVNNRVPWRLPQRRKAALPLQGWWNIASNLPYVR